MATRPNPQVLRFRVNNDPDHPGRGVVAGPGRPTLKPGDIGQTDAWFNNWTIRHMENAKIVTILKEGK